MHIVAIGGSDAGIWPAQTWVRDHQLPAQRHALGTALTLSIDTSALSDRH